MTVLVEPAFAGLCPEQGVLLVDGALDPVAERRLVCHG